MPTPRLHFTLGAMEVVGAFHRAGVPIVAGTDNTVAAVMTNGDYYESEPLWRAADFEPGRN